MHGLAACQQLTQAKHFSHIYPMSRSGILFSLTNLKKAPTLFNQNIKFYIYLK